MRGARLSIIVASVMGLALVAGFLMLRYEFYPANEATVIWRADRLTGGVELCYSNAGRIQCEPYEPGRPWRNP